jgi:antitoxin (DNA-binding transcriptional repressor) of toxin-antitoxin stability system
MTTVSIAEAEKDFAGTLRRVTTGHETVILQRGHKAVAVMAPPDMIEALEDSADIREADKAMAEHEKDPSNALPWAQVKREAGLA